MKPNSTAARRPALRAALALLALGGSAGISACSKTITIGDARPASSVAPAQSPAQSPAQAAPLAPGAGAGAPGAGAGTGAGAALPASNAGLQVVGGTAADHGLSGSGGTVVGAAVQAQPPRWVQFSAVDSPQLGAHLIDVNESTLYRFDEDTANPSTSNCNDACASTWPPVTVQKGGRVYLAGVRASQIGAIQRQDGTVQLTVGGWPVYRYSGDSRPGDANGQGLGGTWFSVAPDGAKSVPQQ